MRGPAAFDDNPAEAATRLRLGWLWILLCLLAISAAVVWGLVRYTNLGRRSAVSVTAASGDQKPPWMLNGGFDKYPAQKPEPAKAAEDLTAKELEAFKKLMAQELLAHQREIDELKRRAQPKPPAPPPPPKEPQKKTRAQPIYLVNEHKIETNGAREYTLPVWTYIPCTLARLLPFFRKYL